MQRNFVMAGLMMILTVALVVSCASRSDVVGQWQRVDGEDQLVFGADGTFTTVDNTGASAAGLYTLHADGTLYYAVTHTDIMQTQRSPVDELAISIAGVQFHREKPEISIMTGDGAAPKVYRRIERPIKPFGKF